MEFVIYPAFEHPVLSCASTSCHIDQQPKPLSEEDMHISCSEMKERAISNPESVCYKRSTLADATSAPY